MGRVIHIRDWQASNADHVYIGRAGGGQDGYFGNPIRAGRACIECKQVHIAPGSTLACYEAWARRRLASDAEFAHRVAGLRDKVLVCFCKPTPCHGDVLARLAGELPPTGLRGEPGLFAALKFVGIACDAEVECLLRCIEAGLSHCMSECWMRMPALHWVEHARRARDAGSPQPIR